MNKYTQRYGADAEANAAAQAHEEAATSGEIAGAIMMSRRSFKVWKKQAPMLSGHHPVPDVGSSLGSEGAALSRAASSRSVGTNHAHAWGRGLVVVTKDGRIMGIEGLMVYG